MVRRTFLADAELTLDSSDSGVTPKVTVKYRFDGNMWYALASKGYRYGGVNGDASGSTYKSDSLWNYETGVRLNRRAGPAARRDGVPARLDRTRSSRTSSQTSTTCPIRRIGNVGKARSIGLEVAARYRVSSGFDFSGSLAYIDAKTKVDVLIPTGGPTSNTVLSGSRLPGTPHLQAAVQGNFNFAGPMDSQGRFNATYTHVGDRVMFLGGNKPASAYDTLDVGLSFSKEAGPSPPASTT